MSDQREEKEKSTPLLEIVVSIIGFLIVFGVVAYLLYQAVLGEETPPNIRIELLTTLPVENGYLVKLNVTNLGTESAASLLIEGTLTENGEEIETGEGTIDYIAGGRTIRSACSSPKTPPNTHSNSAHWAIKAPNGLLLLLPDEPSSAWDKAQELELLARHNPLYLEDQTDRMV
jgi:uncharacterized protein (TIGR02588 family)